MFYYNTFKFYRMDKSTTVAIVHPFFSFQRLFAFLLMCFLLVGYQSLRAQGEDDKEGVIIDQVIAVVGANIILQSDIQTQFEQYRAEAGMQGTEASMKCSILESMVFQKLLLNKAELDSVVITDGQVESELDRRLRYYINLVGSQEKFEEFYRKTVVEFKEELREEVRELLLVQNVRWIVKYDNRHLF